MLIPQMLRRPRIGDFDFIVLVNDATRVFCVYAGEHLHQGGLAGAIFADQGMHLAGAQLKLALAERMNAGKGLFYAFHHH
jgi:hypothetical protein